LHLISLLLHKEKRSGPFLSRVDGAVTNLARLLDLTPHSIDDKGRHLELERNQVKNLGKQIVGIQLGFGHRRTDQLNRCYKSPILILAAMEA